MPEVREREGGPAPGAVLRQDIQKIVVPDGMGLADVTATRIHKNGLDGAPLSFETLKHIGYQRTYALDSTITDSAAALSHIACACLVTGFHGNV